MPLQFISEDAVQKVLSFEELIPALEKALIDLSKGLVQQPVRSVLRIPSHNGWFALMPAVYGEIIGAKLVTVFPGNAQRRVPTQLATIQLFRASTGEALALMDGRLITEMRTAAISAIATRLLAPPEASALAILGSGVQASSHLRALRTVRAFQDIRVWSPNRERCLRFASENSITAAETAKAAVQDADVVVTVTASAEPVVQGSWLKSGAYVNAVGAVGPDRSELDADTMNAMVVVESREAALKESGEIIQSGIPIDAELGELLQTKGWRIPSNRRIVFKSLGIAVEDLAAASLVYQKIAGENGTQTLQSS